MSTISNGKFATSLPSISVAMAVYNGTKFLREQLDSIAAQTVLPDELIICDNCSTDGTQALIAEFAREAAFPVKLYQNDENIGVTANFERAISLCGKEVIFLADCDDVWIPTKIETTAARFACSEEIGLVLSDRELMDEHCNSLGRTWCDVVRCNSKVHAMLERGHLSALLRTQLSGNAMAFRARYKSLVLPIEGGAHDIWIGILVACFARCSFIPESLVKYRLHSGQNSAKLPLTNRAARLRQRMQPIGSSQLTLSAKALNRVLVFRAMSPREATVRELAEYASHSLMRLGMRSGFGDRLRAVFAELLSGRYSRYSSGMLSAIKDALLPGLLTFSKPIAPAREEAADRGGHSIEKDPTDKLVEQAQTRWQDQDLFQ